LFHGLYGAPCAVTECRDFNLAVWRAREPAGLKLPDSEGTRSWVTEFGGPSFAYFSWASKKSKALPGAPGDVGLELRPPSSLTLDTHRPCD